MNESYRQTLNIKHTLLGYKIFDLSDVPQTSNISCTWVGNKIVAHPDVVGASPVGAAPTTSSFSI